MCGVLVFFSSFQSRRAVDSSRSRVSRAPFRLSRKGLLAVSLKKTRPMRRVDVTIVGQTKSLSPRRESNLWSSLNKRNNSSNRLEGPEMLRFKWERFVDSNCRYQRRHVVLPMDFWLIVIVSKTVNKIRAWANEPSIMNIQRVPKAVGLVTYKVYRS